MPGSVPGSPLSHPDRLLENHLYSTAALSNKLATQYLESLLLDILDRLWQACIFHDVAKAHPKFQEQLKKGRGRFPHSEPSAYITFSITRDIMVSETIRRHHTGIDGDFLYHWRNTDYDEIKKVLSEIPIWPAVKSIISDLDMDNFDKWDSSMPSIEEWDELVEDLDEELNLDEKEWLDFKLIYSFLVTADRMDVIAGKDNNIEIPALNISKNIVEKHITGLKSTFLSQWRNEIRSKVIQRAEEVLKGPGIYTLTLPTGAGKTLLGLDLASKIACRYGKKGIIYVLPFISIVEQNSEIARSVFSNVQEDHYLAYEGETNETTPLQQFISVFRYWHEPVVVSTFAKLWEVLYSPRANDCMSFHRLANSVVILDEPQSIPARYWRGFGETLEFLSSQLNTTFIFMTATQPEMAEGTELAPQDISTPQSRYTAYYLGTAEIDQLFDTITGQKEIEKNSALIVGNTRRMALEIYFKAMGQDGQDVFPEKPYFLSSWVTPAHRQQKLKEIKNAEEQGKKRYLVSTQVIEAGVDLDFDFVVRDMGPLDAIIQVAGRCNRHLNNLHGTLYIFKMLNDEGREPAKMVYDKVMLNITEEVLQSISENNVVSFQENDVSRLLKDYYSRLDEALEKSGPWFDVKEGQWECYYSLFEEPVYEEVTVFVDFDGSVKEKLKELQSLGAGFEDRDRRKKIWQELQQHSISLPQKEIKNWDEISGANIIDDGEKDLEPVSDGMWIINPSGIGRIYHADCGFIPVEVYKKFIEQQDI